MAINKFILIILVPNGLNDKSDFLKSRHKISASQAKFSFFKFFSQFFLQTLGIRAVKSEPKISINSSSRTFNPLRMSSWFSYPSQVLQYWFPLFRPAYYPTHLQRPSTVKLPIANQTEKAESKPKTENIFGISGPPDDDIGCLSPDEIEW